MQHLWAPWRMRYILDSVAARKAEAETISRDQFVSVAEPCFICDALAAEPSLDKANQLIWRGQNSALMLNRYPYNNGHLLVVPKSHLPALTDFDGPELFEPLELLKRCMKVMDRLIEPQGYNLGLNQGRIAGAGLPGHLHWHLVPRWLGDVNFMPTIADTRVIVESLDSFYDRFRQEFEQELLK